MYINSAGDISPIRKIFKYNVIPNPDDSTVKVNVQVFDTTFTKYCSPASIPDHIMPDTPAKENTGVLIGCKDSSGESTFSLKSSYNHLTGHYMNSEQMAKYLGLVFSAKDEDSVLRITPYESAQLIYTKKDFENTIFAKKDSQKLYAADISVTMDFENTVDEVVEMLGKGDSIRVLVSVPIDQFSMKDIDDVGKNDKAPVIDNNTKSGIVITSAQVSPVRQRISAFDVENEIRGSIRTVATQFDQYAAQFTDDKSYHSSLSGAMVRFLKDDKVVGSIDLHGTDSGSILGESIVVKAMKGDYDSISVIPCHDFNIPCNNTAFVNGVYRECTNSLEDIGLILLAKSDNLSFGNSVDPLIMCKEGLPALVNGSTDMPRIPTPAEFLQRKVAVPTHGADHSKTASIRVQ